MTTRNRDVVNAQIALMTSSKFEGVLALTWTDDVDDARSVLLLVETFKNKVITIGPFIIYKVVGPVT